ncbi:MULTISPECIES: ATP-independent periplasmic protein-refolding chaperone Spy [Serratia]|uniref:ATP-independent periplasmic protein-refolding chaperone Spy n=1 Tax=Serratia TaxID=613 RepID=UPI0004995B34|nr:MULTISPECIES: ATP-independent periplasmic protein-refolding chaperone Spy [Serratia]AIA46187.1 periplasmic protein [Serratia sp. FS14]ASC80955.1 ATP-independent periplasmic protein-refolding chaperone [Serratia marcescens]AXX22367.1 ATP-independent periplasmic protein-refolding chaperone [Serratia marcescens]AXX27310.1 ATP-independent periplasmic protein-refolding chaperone [Serratia marcescens]MBH2604770.1 ATP-independent periplasmic protein-refolding chaperone [Serratia marcescens]
MRKLTALFIASTLALGSASAAFAADTATAPAADAAPMKMMHHKGEGKGGPFAGLNLTEQQRQQMRDIMKESHQKRGPGMKEERQALHNLVASDSFDEAKAKAQIDAIGKAQSERMLARAKAENKMYNLLTPEQKKQYNENYQKREQKMMDHMNKMKEQMPSGQ